VVATRPSQSKTIEFVGGTSAATPLVAGMIALWSQKAAQSGLPRPGFVPPLLHSISRADPGSTLDITAGTNVVSAGVSCCTAAHGYDMASGLGSPIADQVVKHLHH
jgi:subtilase family serine protease